ncbi:hypothetical protein M501DRAFT_1053504 [Patellaria atrata CBS 101060]|uniref:MARVEL domain-containing protein n=1 Tax=Patellaria atrata CBS 101060 TaxID=1346257 RepID=A0A9P4SHN9_9PEZI|nr:hypothetical protein M501DRAFT_1053504 [Patellaria atrata CBS 101060]
MPPERAHHSPLSSLGLRGGAAPVPSWFLPLRILQALLAILVLGLVAYGLSVNDGGPIRPALITTAVIATLTLLPLLPLSTPFSYATLSKHHSTRLALATDTLALLLWLVAATLLSAYHRVYRFYGKEAYTRHLYGGSKPARRAGVAAAVFAGLEVPLFLFGMVALSGRHCRHLVGSAPAHARDTEAAATVPVGPNPAFAHPAPAPDPAPTSTFARTETALAEGEKYAPPAPAPAPAPAPPATGAGQGAGAGNRGSVFSPSGAGGAPPYPVRG